MSNHINSPNFDLDNKLEEIVSNNIANIVISALKEWNEAEKADALLSASNNFNPHTIVSQLQSLINTIELWYMKEHNSVITIRAKELKISPSRWLIQSNNSKWLHPEVSQNINSLQHTVTQFDSTIEMFALFAKEQSGFSGIAKGLLRGFSNPIDGVMGLFGASSMDKQAQELQKRLEKDQSNMIDSFSALDENIKSAICNAIHSKTGTALDEMTLFFEEEQQKRNQQITSAGPHHDRSAMKSKLKNTLAIIAACILITIISIYIFSKSTYFHNKSSELTAIVNPTTPFKGPGESFGVLPDIAKPEAVIVLDNSVSGWCKVRFSNKSEGWVKAERILITSAN